MKYDLIFRAIAIGVGSISGFIMGWLGWYAVAHEPNLESSYVEEPLSIQERGRILEPDAYLQYPEDPVRHVTYETRGDDPDALEYSAILEHLEGSGLRAIPIKFLGNLGDFAVINDSGTIDSRIASLLRLSPSEVGALNHSIEEAKQQLAQLDSERLSITEITGFKIAFQIDAYPSESERVVRELKDSFLTILGNHSGGVLWTAMNQTDHFWREFGRESVNVEFFVTASEANWQIMKTNPEASEFQARMAGRGTMAPGRYGHLVSLLPAEMRSLFKE